MGEQLLLEDLAASDKYQTDKTDIFLYFQHHKRRAKHDIRVCIWRWVTETKSACLTGSLYLLCCRRQDPSLAWLRFIYQPVLSLAAVSPRLPVSSLGNSLAHSRSRIWQSEMMVAPSLLCHKDTARGTQSPLIRAFLAFAALCLRGIGGSNISNLILDLDWISTLGTNLAGGERIVG